MIRFRLRATLLSRAALDVDVNRYLTSWKVPENGFTARAMVTLRGCCRTPRVSLSTASPAMT
jgi:hypothetical protein